MKRGINMKKLLLSLTIASLLSVSAVAINAKEKGQRGDHERMAMHSLSLSAQQKEDMKQIHKEAKQDLSVYRAERQQNRESMRALMQSNVWDEVAVTAAIEQQMDLNLKTKLIQAKSKNKIFNQLTNEQQAQFIANQEEKKGKTKNLKRNNPEKKMKRLAKALELSDEQEAKIAAMMLSNKQQREANKAEFMSMKEQVKRIIQAKEFDESAWLAVHAQNKQQKLDMAVSKAKSRYDMLSVLSPEQKEKFAKIMKKAKKSKMHKKMHSERKDKSEMTES